MKQDLNKVLANSLGIEASAIRGRYATEYDTEICDADEFEDGMLVAVSDDVVSIGYLTHDESPSDFWASSDGIGELHVFRSEWDRDEFISEAKEEGRMPLVVDNYRHGAEHWSIRNTKNYPDRRWDVAPRGVYLPDSEAIDRYRQEIEAGADETVAMQRLVEDANRILHEYSMHSNGEVYGITVETFMLDREAMIFEQSDIESCWGYIGIEHAVESLREEMSRPEPEPEAIPGPGM